MPRIALNSRRSRTSCSLIALATVMVVGASPAAAQSFDGTGTFMFGSGSITTSPNTTSISVTTPSAVIDWNSVAMGTTNNGVPIVFQPAGTTANFSGGGNYAVLNRLNVVDSTRVIQLNGTIQTIASGALSGTGSIYFYSPSGFMLGGTSIINVPALVLSALPIAVDGSGNFITGTLPNRNVTFGPAVNAGATISTAAGSQITANLTGSYVAMVAPRIVHNGNITVNGSAALVAAEAATINFSTDGLFDIQVTVGTTSSDGINVHGDIGGPTPTGVSDKQGVYLVAVPKNDALTMVIGNGADLGFTLANSAVDDNGVVVLSAGHDITDGAIGARSTGHGASATGNFWFTGAHASSNLFGEATGDANLYSVSPNLVTTFNNDVTVHAANVNMSVSGVGTTLTVGGDLNLSANRTGTAGQSVTAGNVQLYALNSGTLSVAGSTSLTANATGGNASSGSAGSGTGGTIFVNTDDGGSLALHALTATATGTGGNGTAAGVNAGSGTGGTVSMFADTASGLVIDGATALTARGVGGSASGAGLTGNGTGGVARIYVGDDSSLTFNGSVGLNTDGTGGSSSGSANGGTGTGGSSRITAVLGSTSGGLVTINGTASLSANGTGGSSSSGAGGNGIGGVTRMYSTAHHYIINGSAFFSAVGEGGNSGSATGGTGLGGTAEIVSEGSEVDISGNVFFDSPGYGGGGLTGGGGFGGEVNIISENDIAIVGNVTAFAEGEGAQGDGGNGGYGEGGVIDITADGGNLSLGRLTAVSFGQGGDDGGAGTASGDGQGGSIFINALNGGGLSVTNHIFAIAEAYGGRHGLNVTGGSGTGGYVELLAAGTGSQINIGGNVELNALAYGQIADCSTCSGTAGDAFGGSIYVAADGADIAIGGNLLTEANAEGGDLDSGGTTGSGFGGVVTIQALANGSLGIAGSLTATADGLGGGNFGFGTNTGSGTGGDVFLQAFGANANIMVGSYATVTANGESGPFCGECGGGGLAGNGTGGSVTVQAFGASTASLTIEGSLNAEADGQGGDAITGNGGTGAGGSVYLGANDGADVHVLGSLSASAEGWGGYSYGPGDGGAGTGGTVTLNATGGGVFDIDGGGYLDADGYGGGAGISSGGNGGDGLGGLAGVYANGGEIDIGFLLFASAEGHGGYSDNAAGGDGLGKMAEVFATNGGSVSIDGFVSLSVDGFGGSGVTGGSGTGGGSVDEEGVGTDGAHIFAKNGTVSITGTSNLSADGTGGSGASGGVGGDGFGGWTTIRAANSNSGPASITLAAVNISADASGGAGGQGTSGNQGGNGGAGGDATAGIVSVIANAGNGHLLATDVSANAIATGGQGGSGGNGDNLAGGNGGSGGNAEGGSVTVGTASGNGEAAASNLGTATFTSISADSSAAGGKGGAGNFGNPDGSGGAGGVGDGGISLLLVRGSTVNVSGTTTLTSNGSGGDGGSGGGEFGTQGGGGDGYAGEIRVESTSRFLIPAQQGTLNAGAINGTAIGDGGLGSTNGSGIVEGGSGFIISRSTVNIASLDFDISGDEVDPGADPSRISITNATVDVDNAFAFSTIGDLSFYIDNGSLTAGSLNLSAGNFVTDPDNPAPVNRGTAFADSATITTGHDFVADADFDIGSSLVIDAPGIIDAHNFTVDGDLDLSANGGDLTADNLDVTGDINLYAFDAITLDTVLAGFFRADAGGTFDSNNITSDADIRIFAGDDVTLGDLDAGLPAGESSKAVRIDTDGSVLVGDIVALGGIDITAAGSVTGENVITGDGLFTDADGAITYLNISAGLVNPQPPSEPFSVGLDSATSINVGNVDATQGIGFVTSGTLTTGNLTTDSDVLGLAHGNMLVGNISADGRVLLADSSMFTDAGGTIGGQDDDGADIESIFAATPVATNGSITVGNVVAGSFQAAPGTSFSSGDITTDGLLYIDAGTDITGSDFIAGDISSPAAIDIAAGNNILLGDVTSGDSIDLVAGGNITTDDLSAGGSIFVHGGNILAGNITAAQDLTLAAPGTITASDVDAGGLFLALAHGDMSIGDAIAGEVFLADYAMLALGGGEISATCIGNCGTLGADGVVTAPPGGTSYSFVTTEGGASGAGQLPGVGGTNGSLYTTAEFEANAGDDLNFWFNYVTSDGSGFADYAWAALMTASMDPVAILFTARTQPDGTIVPGQGLPGVEATLTPASVPIIDGATTWSPLGGSSGACYGPGCGSTGWINSTYDIANSGSYFLQFGVSNWSDTSLQTGMAFSGITVGGNPVESAPIRTGGSITIGNVETGQFTAAAGTTLTTGIIDSSGGISLDAGGAIATPNLFAGDFVRATGASIATGNIIAGSIDLVATDDITTGNLTTQSQLLLAQEEPGPQMLYPGASITLESGGDIATGNIDSIDGVYADAGGTLTTGTIDALDFVQLIAAGNIVSGAIDAGGFIDIHSEGGSLTLQSLLADGDIDLDASGNIVFTTANAGDEFDFSTGGAITGGNVVAGDEISGDAAGTVTLGNLTAGQSDEDDFSIGIAAIGNITVQNASGPGAVGFATQGNLQTGNLSAGGLVLTMVGGNITTGSITTTGEGGGQVYMADDSMFLSGGGTFDGEGDFDASVVLAADPVATGGSITINGPVSTGLFQAAAGTGLTAQAITADTIEASAGGLATVNGNWNADWITLSSNDIDITGTGSLSSGETLRLESRNPTQMLIGDGLTGTGYALSNAELGRVSGYQVEIIGRGDASAAIDMLIGDLTVTGPLAGSTIEGEEGDLVFATYDFDSEASPSGVIRVSGDINATGFGSDNEIAFVAQRFELDAATGSVSIFSSGSTLGGELGLYANRIHVAAGSILDQLAVNPTYTGYQEDLNEAAAVQRPEGVLRADTLWIESDNLQGILIQNTGTAATPAGFLVRQAFVNDDEEVAGPPGSINLVVNGQVVTEGGTLTGVAARDALITPEDDTTPYTTNSTINGCPLTGQCINQPDEPPPTPDVVDNQIDLINSDPLGDSEFGNEPDIDDGEEGDEGAGNPISPPQPLFDTRPLIPASEVNDPVSGTGNPALLGNDQCDEEDQNQCPAKGDSQ